jgi:protein-L-isoaspartate(D-aspartate) O-methyltransferase
MTQALQLTREDRVLEIGTGSAIRRPCWPRSLIVYTIERIRSLYPQARRLFDSCASSTSSPAYGDGSKGWEEESPFNAIIVTPAPHGPGYPAEPARRRRSAGGSGGKSTFPGLGQDRQGKPAFARKIWAGAGL